MSSLETHVPASGRILVGLAFIAFGVMKATGFSGTVGMLVELGFPMATLFAVVLIAIEIGAGALLVINVGTQWSAYLLALVLVVATLTRHLDTSNIMGSAPAILQHLIMIGGLLAIAGTASHTPIPVSNPSRSNDPTMV